jgi:hypothetical protein
MTKIDNDFVVLFRPVGQHELDLIEVIAEFRN